jgi:hypothetical protein
MQTDKRQARTHVDTHRNADMQTRRHADVQTDKHAYKHSIRSLSMAQELSQKHFRCIVSVNDIGMFVSK